MKRWTNTWAALIVAGFLTVPAAAQTPQTTAAPTTTATATAQQAAQGTPQEHLQKADAAVNSISASAVSGKAKSQIAELKKHMSTLQKMVGSGATAGASSTKWASEAAAADKVIGELLADAPMTGTTGATSATEPRPTGTSGTSASKATAAVSLDAETKAKLTEARADLTAFATAMSSGGAAKSSTDTAASATSAAPSSSASSSSSTAPSTTASSSTAAPSSTAPSTAAPSTAAPSSATPAAPTTAPASPTTQPSEPTSAPTTAPAQPPTSQPDPASPASPALPTTQPPAEPTSPAQPPSSTSPAPAQPSTSAAPAAQDPSAPTVDATAAKAALTAARDALSQMTQLPAAQQLSGENRTQVTQLIANFNELITTNSEWKASYAKVDANLTALIGSAETTDEPKATPTPAPTGTSGTAGTTGAVGTSGTEATSIDPQVKAKLAEFRTHLKAFEKAAGGGAK